MSLKIEPFSKSLVCNGGSGVSIDLGNNNKLTICSSLPITTSSTAVVEGGTATESKEEKNEELLAGQRRGGPGGGGGRGQGRGGPTGGRGGRVDRGGFRGSRGTTFRRDGGGFRDTKHFFHDFPHRQQFFHRRVVSPRRHFVHSYSYPYNYYSYPYPYVDTITQCTFNDQCPSGYVCLNGQCVPANVLS